YLQTKKNDGPVFAWHTWDGLSYDPRVGRMFWVVLDDQKTNEHYLKTWCRYTGRDFETEKKKLKPGTGLWSFDPGTRKWSRWLGEKPHARMRGMGGSLHYLQDLRKMVWYCSATNVVPHEYGMWSYDAAANKWEEIKPNGGKGIGGLVHKEKAAPRCEAQMAYSPRHRKMVSVVGKDTFVYDVAANAWSKACTEETQYASDCRTVFDYDGSADLFLLHNAPKGQWDKTRDLRAFDLKTGKWQTLAPQGAPVPKGIRKGFYDPAYNVFVLADRGPVWVYRHKKPAPGASSALPEPAASVRPKPSDRSDRSDLSDVPLPPSKPRVRTPQQVCTGWFSSAMTYKRAGLKSSAKRCLNNIIKAYPGTDWAARARRELDSL
ncbi:MAG: tetratricopeptide repeat protein, partial [Planctomycetota bacterium]